MTDGVVQIPTQWVVVSLAVGGLILGGAAKVLVGAFDELKATVGRIEDAISGGITGLGINARLDAGSRRFADHERRIERLEQHLKVGVVVATLVLGGCGGVKVPEIDPCVIRPDACKPPADPPITTTTTTTTTTTLPADPDPSPVCREGQTCGCWHRPPPGPWVQLPACAPPPPPPPPTTLPGPPPPADVPRADGARLEIARHGVDGYMVTLIPTRAGQDVRPKDRAAAIGPLAWRWSSCHAPGEAPRSWADITAGEDPLRALVWISAGDCVPKGKTRTRVRVASCLTGVSFEVMIPTGEISRGPAVQPCAPASPPPPPPASGVRWNESEKPGSVPEVCGTATPKHLAAVLAAVQGEPAVIRESEAAFYARVCPRLRPALDCALYGEELAVAKDSSRSENYDLLAWGEEVKANRLRTGPGVYRSTCAPATRSAAIGGEQDARDGETVPGGEPAGDEQPPAPPGSYPLPVTSVRAKVHTPASERDKPGLRMRGYAVLDAVALSAHPSCAPRVSCPACGPEPAESDPEAAAKRAARVACDVALGPRWEGGEEHQDNPWLRWAKPGQRARVCVGAVCSEWVTGQ